MGPSCVSLYSHFAAQYRRAFFGAKTCETLGRTDGNNVTRPCNICRSLPAMFTGSLVRSNSQRIRCPLCATASCKQLCACAARVSSISTLHVDPNQPNLRPDPDPNPNPNPTPNPDPLGDSRSAGAVTRLFPVFFQKNARRPKYPP